MLQQAESGNAALCKSPCKSHIFVFQFPEATRAIDIYRLSYRNSPVSKVVLNQLIHKYIFELSFFLMYSSAHCMIHFAF